MDATKPSNDLQSLRLKERDGIKALDEYHRALGDGAHSTVSIKEDADHKLICTLAFTIEGERELYTVCVAGYSKNFHICTSEQQALEPRDAAHYLAAWNALSIIDAIRVRNHAKAFISSCSLPYACTDRSAFDWFTGYCTMRGEHLRWRKDALVKLSPPDIVGMFFDHMRICDHGNYAYSKEEYVSSDGMNNEEAINDAMFKAVHTISGLVPPGFYARLSTPSGHDANYLVGLCEALDCQMCFPFAVEQVWTGGKSETKVSAILHKTSGAIAYTSPTVIVETDEGSIGAAKNKVARYALDWMAGRIFDDDNTKK